MANYNRLKDAIITVIKTNGNNEITGVLLQQVLLAMIGSLGTGYQFAGVLTSETVLGQSDKRLFYIAPPGEYDNNFVVPGGCLGLVYGSAEWTMAVLNILAVVDDLVTGGTNAALSAEQGKVLKTMLEEAVANITALIPSQASSQNQLADKAFVNSSIATNTANYISDNGQPFQSLADLLAYSGVLTNNDYAFVVGTDANGNTTYTRYKYSARTDEWAAEYVLNNSSFTAAQWAAISSGITAALVQKLSELPTEIVTYTAQTLTAAQKQQVQANIGLQSVLKYTEQTLTDEQKLQVLANLGLQNVLRYAEQSLTDEQKAQARTNIGATAPEVFWAEYGSTTAAEIDAAIAAGKAVMVRYGTNDYLLSKYGEGQAYYYFGNILGSSFCWLRLQVSNNAWVAGVQGAEVVSNKSQSVETDKNNTTKYPSTKAVADAIEAGKQIFWATYGETTAQELSQAVAAGKQLFVNDSGYICTYGGNDGNYHYFFAVIGNITYRRLQVQISTNSWARHALGVEGTANKSQDIEADKTSTTKYPSTKAVADALAGKQNTIDSEHKLDYSLIANTPDIPTEVFPVTYGTTTQAEIKAAVAAGKLPVCKYGDNLYVYAGESSAEYSQFTSVLYDTAYRIFVKDSTWGRGNYNIYSKPEGGIPASDIANGVIPAAPVNADWNATEGLAKILNKPSIPTQYAGSPTAGGFANKAVAIPFGSVDADSTATDIKATVDSFPEELTDGVCAFIRNDIIASASGWTLNINGTGAKPVYASNADATRTTTVFSATVTYLFIYNSTRVEGGCWDMYYGYNTDTNTIGYSLRTNTMTLPTTSACYRYRLLFTSADGKYFVPANASSSSNATSTRTTTQTPIDPFGSIRYYSSTSTVSSGSRPGATTLWEQYSVTLGYSFNRTGAALTLTAWKPVYIKCAPQADGSAIIDASTPYVQDLPTSADGKIYIFLGVATSATQVEVVFHHPVYYNDGKNIKNWDGKISKNILITINGTKASISGHVLPAVAAIGFSAVATLFGATTLLGNTSILITIIDYINSSAISYLGLLNFGFGTSSFVFDIQSQDYTNLDLTNYYGDGSANDYVVFNGVTFTYNSETGDYETDQWPTS